MAFFCDATHRFFGCARLVLYVSSDDGIFVRHKSLNDDVSTHVLLFCSRASTAMMILLVLIAAASVLAQVTESQGRPVSLLWCRPDGSFAIVANAVFPV